LINKSIYFLCHRKKRVNLRKTLLQKKKTGKKKQKENRRIVGGLKLSGPDHSLNTRCDAALTVALSVFDSNKSPFKKKKNLNRFSNIKNKKYYFNIFKNKNNNYYNTK